jgi:hypothetical protein
MWTRGRSHQLDAEIRWHANWRPTDARGHLGAAPPGVRRVDTRPPRGARSLRFACILTRLGSLWSVSQSRRNNLILRSQFYETDYGCILNSSSMKRYKAIHVIGLKSLKSVWNHWNASHHTHWKSEVCMRVKKRVTPPCLLPGRIFLLWHTILIRARTVLRAPKLWNRGRV